MKTITVDNNAIFSLYLKNIGRRFNTVDMKTR